MDKLKEQLKNGDVESAFQTLDSYLESILPKYCDLDLKCPQHGFEDEILLSLLDEISMDFSNVRLTGDELREKVKINNELQCLFSSVDKLDEAKFKILLGHILRGYDSGKSKTSFTAIFSYSNNFFKRAEQIAKKYNP